MEGEEERGGAEISPISYPQIASDTLVSVTSLLYFSAYEHCEWTVDARAAEGRCEKPCSRLLMVPESWESTRSSSCVFLVLEGVLKRFQEG